MYSKKKKKKQRNQNDFFFFSFPLLFCFFFFLNIPFTYLMMEKILSERSMEKLFGNIESICNFHNQLLSDLQSLQTLDSADKYISLGGVFLKLSPFLKLYGNYVQNYESSGKHLTKIGSNKKFSNFLKTKQKQTGLILGTLLQIPALRLPQYNAYLGAIILSPECDEEIKVSIENAIAVIQRTMNEISKGRDEEISRRKVLEIQVDFFHNSVDIADPVRQCLKTGVVSLVTQKSLLINYLSMEQVLLTLFNDMILIGTKNGKPLKAFRLEHLTLIDSPDLLPEEISNIGFKIDCKELGSSTLIATKNSQIRTQWIDLLKEHINNAVTYFRGKSTVYAGYFEDMIFKKTDRSSLPFPQPLPSHIGKIEFPSSNLEAILLMNPHQEIDLEQFVNHPEKVAILNKEELKKAIKKAKQLPTSPPPMDSEHPYKPLYIPQPNTTRNMNKVVVYPAKSTDVLQPPEHLDAVLHKKQQGSLAIEAAVLLSKKKSISGQSTELKISEPSSKLDLKTLQSNLEEKHPSPKSARMKMISSSTTALYSEKIARSGQVPMSLQSEGVIQIRNSHNSKINEESAASSSHMTNSNDKQLHRTQVVTGKESLDSIPSLADPDHLVVSITAIDSTILVPTSSEVLNSNPDLNAAALSRKNSQETISAKTEEKSLSLSAPIENEEYKIEFAESQEKHIPAELLPAVGTSLTKSDVLSLSFKQGSLEFKFVSNLQEQLELFKTIRPSTTSIVDVHEWE